MSQSSLEALFFNSTPIFQISEEDLQRNFDDIAERVAGGKMVFIGENDEAPSMVLMPYALGMEFLRVYGEREAKNPAQSLDESSL
jgi:hypothetical protein